MWTTAKATAKPQLLLVSQLVNCAGSPPSYGHTLTAGSLKKVLLHGCARTICMAGRGT